MVALLLACAGGPAPTDPCDTPGAICTWVGDGRAGLPVEGACREEQPTYLVIDAAVGPDGLLYYSDWNNHAIMRVIPGEGCDRVERLLSGLDPALVMLDSVGLHARAIAFRGETLLVSSFDRSQVLAVDLVSLD